jgi:hypothetical protein
MTTAEWLEFVDFASHELYLFIAFLCGLIIGYLVGFRNGQF